jgi:hypothetical protein
MRKKNVKEKEKEKKTFLKRIKKISYGKIN